MSPTRATRRSARRTPGNDASFAPVPNLLPEGMSILRHTLISGTATLVSRLLGFVRDAAMAWLLGAGPAAEALSVALRLPYLLRRMLGEGTLSLALTSLCVQAGERGPSLVRALSRRIAAWTALAMAGGLLLAEPLARLLAPGADAQLCDLAALGLRLALPYLPLAVLAAGSMAVLHSRERFWIPGLAPVLLNVVVIGAAWLALGKAPRTMLALLAGAVSLGGLGQWLLLASAARWRPGVRAGSAHRRDIDQRHGSAGDDRPCPENPPTAVSEPDVRPNVRPEMLAEMRPEMRADAQVGASPPGNAPDSVVSVTTALRPALAGILGAATPQLAFLLAAALCSVGNRFGSGGSMAALFYAERLIEFPLGILGAAVGMAAAPRLARLGGDVALFAEVRRATTLARMLTLPAAVGLVAVSAPLVGLVFGRGAFDAEAARLTGLALCAYAPGLPAYALSRPLLAACHARGMAGTPLRVGLASLGLTLVLGGLALPWLPLLGPPLAVSAGLWLNVALLWRGLRQSEKTSSSLSALQSTTWLDLAREAVATGATWGLAALVVHEATLRGLGDAATLALAIPAGMVAFAVSFFGLGGRRVLTRCLRDH